MAAAACDPDLHGLALLLRVKLLFTPLPVYDFMIYWSAGHLFLSGANPYSGQLRSMRLERSIGWSYMQPMTLLYPPWALPFVVPLGMLPFWTAHFVWLAVSLILEVVSAIALWRYFGGERSKQWIALILFARVSARGVRRSIYGPDHTADSGRADGISFPVAPP